MNLGLVSEDFALEYLIKLVKDSIDSNKYNTLTTKEDRISYLRALAIGSLINDAVKIFIESEELILAGNFPYSLMDKSKYKAQMNDIIKLSVKNIYQSREVIEKELIGYQIINNLLDKFITAYNNNYQEKATNFDALLLKILPEKYHLEKDSLYERLLHICHFISILTDGNALLYNKIVASNNY
jgi:dGTPase